jgi:Na+/melibiose symporter-like transporter
MLGIALRSARQRLPLLGYSGVMLASSALNCIFVTYYVEFFMRVSHLSSRAFFLSQLFYMIWNMCNDPLFGWLSDSKSSSGSRRISAIFYGGPMWALSFALIWFPWGQPDSFASQVHCCVCLLL